MPHKAGSLPLSKISMTSAKKVTDRHMSRFGLRRSRVAVLTVAAMVASVLAIGVSSTPVSGDAGAPDVDNPAGFSACVGAALDSAGFEDIVDTGYEPAVDCLAHYKITVGTGDGNFNPREGVQRWQMALFMTRASGPAGIQLGEATDQGFTDIGDLSDEAKDAVNQFAGSGIGFGTSTTTFSPNQVVTRAEMARFLFHFLQQAKPGQGGTAGQTLIGAIMPDDDNFTDLANVSVAADTAIRRLYELGVTAGTTATTFSPTDGVTRGQMARFITRTLGHTMARPVGISLQISAASVDRGADAKPNLLVSIRDEDFKPSVGERVNLLSAETKNLDKLFFEDGSCDKPQFINGAEACTIGAGRLTDLGGEYLYAEVVDTDAVNDFTFWVWTAAQGTSYDREDHADVTASTTFSVVEDADTYRFETDLPDGVTLAKYGTKVAITIQLLDTDDIPEGETSNPLSVAGKEFIIQTVSRGADGSSDTAVQKLKTDEDGRIVLSFTREDLDANADNADSTVTVTVTAAPDGIAAPMDSAGMDVTEISVAWSDDAPIPTKLAQELSANYAVLPMERGEAGTYTNTATLTDQYGQGIAGQQITFAGTGSWGVGTPAGVGLLERQRFTDANGAAVHTHTLAYNADTDFSATTGKARSEAQSVSGAGLTAGADAMDMDGTESPENAIYWSERCVPGDMNSCNSADAATFESVVVIDTDAKEFVILRGDETTGKYFVVSYDSNDFFSADGAPVTIDGFEAMLATHDDINPADDPDDPSMKLNKGVINIANYGAPDAISLFTFKKSP